MVDPKYLLTEDEIAEVNKRVGGTRIKALLEAQAEKAIRVREAELAHLLALAKKDESI